MAICEDKIREELKKVIDPELFVNIVDLGLIYVVDMKPAGTIAEQRASSPPLPGSGDGTAETTENTATNARSDATPAVSPSPVEADSPSEIAATSDVSTDAFGTTIDADSDQIDVFIEMTMTSPACPAGPQLIGNSKQVVSAMAEVNDVEIKIVMEPPWTPERMTDDARDQLGIF